MALPLVPLIAGVGTAIVNGLAFLAKSAWDLAKWAAVQGLILFRMAIALLTYVSMRLSKYFVLKVLMWGAIFAAFYTFVYTVVGSVGHLSFYSISTVVSYVADSAPLQGWKRFVWDGGLCLVSLFGWLHSYVSFWFSCFVAYRVYINVVALKRAGSTLWKEPSNPISTGSSFWL